MTALLALLIRLMRGINRAVELALGPVATLVMAAMLGTVVWTVVARLSGISAPWTEKVMLILLPSLAFIVAPLAYRRAANVTLEIVRDRLPARVQRVHALLLHVMLFFVLLVALDLTLRKIGLRFGAGEALIDGLLGLDLASIRPFKARIKIPVLGIPWKWVYTVMPVCVALMLLASIELILRQILGLLDPDNTLVRPVRTFEDIEDQRE